MIGAPATPGFFSRPRAAAALQAIAGDGSSTLGPADIAANHGALDTSPVSVEDVGQAYDQRRRDAYYADAIANEPDPNRQQQLRIEQQTGNLRAQGQPDWSAFFGRLGAEGDEANQAGYDFKADLGSGGARPTRTAGGRALAAIGG